MARFKYLSPYILALWALCTASQADVRVYRSADGSILITDQQQSRPDYTLLKTYRTDTAPGTRALRGNKQARALRTVISRYDPLIEQVSLREDLDRALLKAVVHVESGFNARAISHKGAVGLMQLMPPIARQYNVESRLDPVENVSAGGRHLKELLDYYDDDTVLALAAYNAGKDAVRKYSGVPPYAETRNYVKKVLELTALYKRG